MWCHLMLATPVLGLILFFILPFSLALVFYLVLVLASLAIYYKVMESMQMPVLTGPEALTGQTVNTDANGLVYYRGERWTAVPRLPNQKVRIVALRGLNLQVEPVANRTGDEPV